MRAIADLGRVALREEKAVLGDKGRTGLAVEVLDFWEARRFLRRGERVRRRAAAPALFGRRRRRRGRVGEVVVMEDLAVVEEEKDLVNIPVCK